jgi:hypothetical protein
MAVSDAGSVPCGLGRVMALPRDGFLSVGSTE